MSLPAPPKPSLGAELLRKLAKDIGDEVVFHIESQYPAMFLVVSKNARVSVRNLTHNDILGVCAALDKGESVERILERRQSHRRTIRRLKRMGDEAERKRKESAR